MPRTVSCLILVALTGLCFDVTHTEAGDWTRFRGTNGEGVADDKDYPVSFGPTENLLWKVELPGPGASSPIVIGNKVFVSSYREYGVERDQGDPKNLERVLLCANRSDGKSLWEAKVPNSADNEDRYGGFISSHGYATNTPTTDGERVFAFFGKSGLIAFDMDGKELWKVNLGTGSAPMGWGTGPSPVLYKNTVIVPAFSEGKALVALDKATGKEVWKIPAPGFHGSWSTPNLVTLPDGKQELVVSVPYEIWGIDPDTGTFLWFAEGIREQAICPSLVSKNGVVFAIGGRQGGAVAVKAGGRDEVTKTHTVWRLNFGSYVTSPVIVGDHLYWVSDKGIACCVKTEDGSTVFRERLAGSGDLYASLVLASGRLYATTRGSGVFVLAAKPEFENLAQNKLDDDAGTCNGTPAFSDGQIFLRTNKYLYCFGKK